MNVIESPRQHGSVVAPSDAGRMGWRDLLWLTVRRHRALLVLSALVTAASAVVLLVFAAMFHHYAGCPKDGAVTTCYDDYRVTARNFADVLRSLIILPALAGAFWGAPLVAREFETGTLRLALGQDLTPRRWLSGQLAVLAAALSGLALIVAFCARVALPEAITTNEFSGDTFDTKLFETTPQTFTGYALLSLAIGTLIGTLLRRVLPAVAVTGAAFFGAWSVLRKLRHSYLPPRFAVVNEADASHAVRERVYRYQPQSRATEFEWIETGLCVLVAALLVWIAVDVFRRRAR